ncbi:MAG TPA: tRNA lysidine(34) synthetase TilS [Thermohalobaculum sp.]|nr:tRNA lysidine(34) synthetase TilS [Thermohalobaculum sp.]
MPRKRPSSCSAAEAVPAAFVAAWNARPPDPFVLAVSGGSDSVALLRLVTETGAAPPVVTVDHGLRPESTEEAAWVGRLCRDLGLEHHVLRWREAAAGNLQAAARNARYRLIGDWARPRGVVTVVTGHTLDDQAETVLMRLARGSGLDGLAAMRPRARHEGIAVYRPLLGLRRDALRKHLRSLGQDWLDDPSNDDRRFDRVKAREALAHLAVLGLTAERLARTADHMARARDALEATLDGWTTANMALRPTGEVSVVRSAYRALPEELRLRLLTRALGLVAGRLYRPRFDALAPLAARIAEGGECAQSLHGCLVRADADSVRVFREPGAVAGPEPIVAGAATWDGRWRVTAGDPAAEGLSVAALGERGLALIDPAATGAEWQAAPRLARLTAPGVWAGDRLVAAPLAGCPAGAGWRAALLPPRRC